MAAITGAVMAATAVAGIGLQAYGMSKQQEGLKQQQAAAQAQAAGAAVQAQGAQKQSEGALLQVQGASAQNQAQKEITKQEFLAEEQRFKAMQLDARRRNLEIVRMHQRANAAALTTASAQGAMRSSALSGAYGQTSGQTGYNLLGVSQNLGIGENLFGINKAISGQRLAYAAGGDIINQGQGVIAEGSGIIARGAGMIAAAGGQMALGQGIAAQGQGISSLGGSLVQGASTFGNVAGSAYSSYNSNIYQPLNSFFGINNIGRPK